MRAPAECLSMAEVRSAIDALDQEVVHLLAQRAAYIDRASELKLQNGWPARIPDRVEEVIANARTQAEAQGLEADLVEAMWRLLVNWSIDREEQVLGPDRPGEES